MHCRLFINDQLISENINPTVSAKMTQCVNLTDNVAHEITLYFATAITPSNVLGPIAVRWAACADNRTPPSSATSYSSFRPR